MYRLRVDRLNPIQYKCVAGQFGSIGWKFNKLHSHGMLEVRRREIGDGWWFDDAFLLRARHDARIRFCQYKF